MSLEPSGETKYKTHKVSEFKDKRLLSSSVFFDDNTTKSFFYPNLIEGGKTKLEYVTESTTPELIAGCYFGDYINTEFIEYTFSHPSSIKVSFKLFNGADTLLTYSQTEKKGIITHKWIAKNLEPMKNEGGAPSVLELIPHVYPIINSYQVDGKEIKVLGSIDELHNYYTTLLNQTPVDSNFSELQVVVDSVIKGKTTDLEKVEAIYEYAQKDIKYVAYEDGLGGFVPRSPMTVFDRRYGDCKDMASLQVKMLDLAGLTGNVAWVGTRSKPYTYQELPTPGCDNHMIGVYKSQDGRWYILDATGTYSPFGYPSEFIQDKELLIHLSEDEYEVYKVKIVNADRNRFVDSVSMKLNDGVIEAQGHASFSGYQFSDFKYQIVNKDSLQRFKRFKSRLEKGNNKFFFELDNYDLDGSSYGTVDYSFTLKDYLKSSGDEVYFNMNMVKLLSTEKIEDDRENALQLNYLKEYSLRFSIDLQNKYVVDFLPKDKKYESEGFSYSISYQQIGTKIYYSLDLNIDHMQIKSEDFEEWNKMIRGLNKKYKEVIILKTK